MGDSGGRQRLVGAEETPGAMRVIGCLFVALMVGDQGGAVERWLRQHHPQEQVHFHGAEQHRLGWEHGPPVLLVAHGQRGVQEQSVPSAGPPLSG
jgi:hypothetical protein